jgi:two-component system response regulator NreC
VIRVLLAGGQGIVRESLRRLLAAGGDCEVCSEAARAEDAVGLARRDAPDVVLLDIDLERADGLAVIARLSAAGGRVVVLSAESQPALARQALQAGARGYVLTQAAELELPDAIRAVVRDGIYVHATVAARLAAEASEARLSEREQEILTLIALGHTNREIAARLVVSVRTVEAHRRRILNKLHLSTRADLVRYALDRRLVSM